MNRCLNCGAEIIQKNGGKERKFCDNNNSCKQAYHNKNKKEKRFVQLKSFQELKERFDEVVEENKKLKTMPQNATKEAQGGNKTEKPITSKPTHGIKQEEPKNDDKAIRERIKQLEHELAHPPKTFTVSGMKYHYFNEREIELRRLKNQ